MDDDDGMGGAEPYGKIEAANPSGNNIKIAGEHILKRRTKN